MVCPVFCLIVVFRDTVWHWDHFFGERDLAALLSLVCNVSALHRNLFTFLDVFGRLGFVSLLDNLYISRTSVDRKS